MARLVPARAFAYAGWPLAPFALAARILRSFCRSLLAQQPPLRPLRW